MTFLTLRPAAEANLNAALCDGCGVCCMRGPGATLPTDFAEPLGAALRAAFASGKFRAMPVNGALIVLPRTTGQAVGMIDARDGPCALLGPGGCSLSAEERPSQCRALVPRLTWGLSGLSCYDQNAPNGSTAFYADAWRPYERVVLDAVHDVERAIESSERAG